MASYRIRVGGRREIGPFPVELIARGIQLGRIPTEAEVREVGAGAWCPLAAIDEFYEAMGLGEARTEVMAGPPEFHVEDEESTRVLASLWTGARQNEADPATLRSLVVRSRQGSASHGERTPRPSSNAADPLPAPQTTTERTATKTADPADVLTPVPHDASMLMDADDDEEDIRVIRPACPVEQREIPRVIPAAGRPAERSAAPPRVQAPRLDRADELTAPARRLRRQQARTRTALAMVSLAFLVVLSLLVAVLINR